MRLTFNILTRERCEHNCVEKTLKKPLNLMCFLHYISF